jgi:hypothetical protein
MTDAKEPEVITQLLHSEECGRSVLYDVYGNAICIIAAILNHIDALTRERDEARRTSQYWKDEKLASESAIDTLTRERDEAVKRRREIDDEAFDYAEQIETLKTQLAAARVVTDAMIERAREAYRNAWWHEEAKADGEPFTMEARNRVWIAALTAALAQEDA